MNNLSVVKEYLGSGNGDKNDNYVAIVNKVSTIAEIIGNKKIAESKMYGATLRLAFTSSNEMEKFVD